MSPLPLAPPGMRSFVSLEGVPAWSAGTYYAGGARQGSPPQPDRSPLCRVRHWDDAFGAPRRHGHWDGAFEASGRRATQGGVMPRLGRERRHTPPPDHSLSGLLRLRPAAHAWHPFWMRALQGLCRRILSGMARWPPVPQRMVAQRPLKAIGSLLRKAQAPPTPRATTARVGLGWVLRRTA